MDTAHQWPQGIVVKPIEEILLTNNSCPKPAAAAAAAANNNSLERKASRPQTEQALNCPRCNSTNTKFCYYNNYSLTQPRYFCKTCRRYWTEGGSLRNIPVGGGSRKNKRSSSSAQSTSSTTTTSNNISSAPKRQPQNLPDLIQGQDLNLGTTYPTDFLNAVSDHHHHHYLQNPNKSSPSSTTTTSHLSALELLTGLTSRGFNSFMPIPIPDPTTTADNNTVYSSTTPSSGNNNNMIPTMAMHDFKPTLNFSLDGLGNGYGPLHGVQESNGRLLFPFEDLKQVGGNGGGGGLSMDQSNKEHGDSTGYWTGMLGEGGSW